MKREYEERVWVEKENEECSWVEQAVIYYFPQRGNVISANVTFCECDFLRA